MQNFLQSEGFIIALISSASTLAGIILSQIIEIFKLKSAQSYERQTFLRKKYEELVFRLIDFASSVKKAELEPNREPSLNNIDFSEFAKRGGQIEVITELYFPKLSQECKEFLEASRRLATAQYFDTSNPISRNLNELNDRFDEKYDILYRKIKKHIMDYT